ncbi:M20/M25/M40 family metallo-hydrolase, partial [Streptomyces sp. SID3343]|nr:M20/M25/M40 family metallo-hydrolase [Streptomyces sp. SID3343]
MLTDLAELVGCESFTADLAAVAHSAEVVAAQGTRLLGASPERIVVDGVTHLRWTFGAPRVLLLGHHDTVWPIGSLVTHPWSVVDGIARGPGVFDMKAGLVQMFHALGSTTSREGLCVLVTGDEEIGSPTSRALIEDAARACTAAFVLEGSADGGALKIARKGVSRYELVVHGKAAHSGLEPEKGVNAAIEAAHLVLALAALPDRADAGALGPLRTTVTPTVITAGSAANTVPAHAKIAVDVRTPTLKAQERVDELLRALAPTVAGARIEVLGRPNRPPLEASASEALFALAADTASRLGQAPLRGVPVGGGSDGNFTAGVGCPTLDG